MAHLESRFLPGMTWENRGEWHIDHFIPCSRFDLSLPAHQKICFNYRNLRPLWGKDNTEKSDKLIGITEEQLSAILSGEAELPEHLR